MIATGILKYLKCCHVLYKNRAGAFFVALEIIIAARSVFIKTPSHYMLFSQKFEKISFGSPNIFLGLLTLGIKESRMAFFSFWLNPWSPSYSWMVTFYIKNKKLEIKFDFTGSMGKVWSLCLLKEKKLKSVSQYWRRPSKSWIFGCAKLLVFVLASGILTAVSFGKFMHQFQRLHLFVDTTVYTYSHKLRYQLAVSVLQGQVLPLH